MFCRTFQANVSARFGLTASVCQHGGCAAFSASQQGLAHGITERAEKSPGEAWRRADMLKGANGAVLAREACLFLVVFPQKPIQGYLGAENGEEQGKEAVSQIVSPGCKDY